MIKNQQGYDAATDGRIRKIEYRTEKNKMLPSHPWHPFRPISVDDGEIKHVYHTKWAVNGAGGLLNINP